MTDENTQAIPKQIMDALASEEVVHSIQDIGAHLALHIDQQGEFLDLVTDLMLGVTKWEDFQKVVIREFSLTEEQKQYVVSEIETKVLGPISGALHNMYAESEAEKEAADAAEIAQSKPVNPYRNADPYREPIE